MGTLNTLSICILYGGAPITLASCILYEMYNFRKRNRIIDKSLQTISASERYNAVEEVSNAQASKNAEYILKNYKHIIGR